MLSNGEIRYGPDTYSYNSTLGVPTSANGPIIVPGFTFNGFAGVLANNNGYLAATPFGSQAAFVQSYPDAGSSLVWSVSGFTPGKTYFLSFYDLGYTSPETLDVSVFGKSLDFTPGSTTTYLANRFSFVATASSGDISFTALSSNGNYVTALDNLSISSVPEPAAWALMLVGFGGLGAALRSARRKRVAATA